jgi:hypothetical protein
MSTIPLPDAVQVKALLGCLFEGLTVRPAARLDVTAASASYVAIYISDDGVPRALCACDLSFAAHGGAVLSMLPPASADEAVEAKQLSSAMSDNLREVMNICTRLILRDGSPHLRLEQVVPADRMSADAASIARSKTRVDFEVGLGRYGTGILAFITP